MKSVSVTDVPADALLIDVREADEYAAGHAKGAVLIPLSEFASRIEEIDADRNVHIICELGGRSAQACEYLEQARGLEATNVEGGTSAWRSAGLPMA